jgi:hypothetical protein
MSSRQLSARQYPTRQTWRFEKVIKSLLVVVVAVLLAHTLASVPTEAATADHSTVTIKLLPVGTSKINGTAEIQALVGIPENPPAVSVTIRLEGMFTETPWPADIHAGSCATAKLDIAYKLNPAIDGESKTTLHGATIKHLLSPPRYSIEIHNPANTKVVACGFIDVPR